MEIQRRETQDRIEKIAVPRAEGDHKPVYIKVSEKNALKNVKETTGR
ncbi:MAG: hypothetical protein HDR06_12280 [Lachnospiraceae bacterium]|nr:hypothetical protein [Lachnospiraceae bacterium]